MQSLQIFTGRHCCMPKFPYHTSLVKHPLCLHLPIHPPLSSAWKFRESSLRKTCICATLPMEMLSSTMKKCSKSCVHPFRIVISITRLPVVIRLVTLLSIGLRKMPKGFEDALGHPWFHMHVPVLISPSKVARNNTYFL